MSSREEEDDASCSAGRLEESADSGADPAARPATGEDSSDSDGETEPAPSFHRRISTNKQIKCSVCIKEGYLMKQTSSFQRWKRRYFKLKGNKLYYAKDTKYEVFDEIELVDLSIAETSAKSGGGHCFQVITAFRCFTLSADTRRDMEEWTAALKSASKRQFFEGMDHLHTLLAGQHNWHVMSHARPTYCNVCREALSGVTSHGLSCEVCKFKCHKRCAAREQTACKWTTLASMGRNIIEEEDGTLSMPHQWLEGNLSVSARCVVCDRTCGSVLRLQDWRCLWCKGTVHAACRQLVAAQCPLGVCKVSVVPPTALHSIGADDSWEAARPLGCSPLLVFVNSKSGDRQGIKFLRRFKQLLNPAQVFDLMNSGPALGLRLFKKFDQFRILVCGGDGSVSWVLSQIDQFDMHRQCQVGVLPLGTGNDLARVLGWGATCDDDANLAHMLEKYECATIKMLDRWSIAAMSTTVRLPSVPGVADALNSYEDSVAEHLARILQSDQHSDILQSTGVLCETIRDLISRVGDSPAAGPSLTAKCSALDTKLSLLVTALREESRPARVQRRTGRGTAQNASRNVVMLRANSLKRAIRGILAHVETAIDDQNWEPAECVVEDPPTTASAESEGEGKTRKPADVSLEEVDDTVPDDDAAAREEGENRMSVDRREEGLEATDAVKEEEDREGWRSSDDLGDMTPESRLKAEESRGPSEWLPQVSLHTSSPMASPYRMASTITTAFPVRPWSPRKSDGHLPPWTVASQTPHNLDNPWTAASQQSVDLAPECLEQDSAGLLQPSSTDRRPSAEIADILTAAAAADHDKDTLLVATHPHPLSISPLPAVGGGGEPLPEALPAPSLFADNAVHLSINSSSGNLLENYDEGDEPILVEQKPITADANVPPIQVHDASPEDEEEERGGEEEEAVEGEAVRSAFSSSTPPAEDAPDRGPASEEPEVPADAGTDAASAADVTSAGGSLVQNVLLAHADALCAAASPLVAMQHTLYSSGFEEKGVMNNYFGIGIDAKISLDFHNKREGNPHKCRSRTKNFMWYGVLGSKELIQKTYKNLEQRVKLECDGHVIPLPSLQGIVVLNIPSFMGGTNFWGRWREEDCFLLPSFDDRILEVVAVFGTVQMAASRIINLQHHRIAQCQTVQITILGDEEVPVEVDGEAWVQPPGVIKISHKNRVQMLARNRSLEVSLRTWQEKQQRRQSVTLGSSLTDDEQILLRELIDSSLHFLRASKLFMKRYSALPGGSELRETVSSTAAVLERLAPPAAGSGQPSIAELGSHRHDVSDLVSAVRSLHSQMADFLHDSSSQINVCGGVEEQLMASMVQLESELRHAQSVHGVIQFTSAPDTGEVSEKQRRPSRGGLFRLRLRREGRAASAGAAATPPTTAATPSSSSVSSASVADWRTDEVVAWLESIALPEYKDSFIRHDVRGPELLNLERRDLKELGIIKIGHIKRIQQAIKEIRNAP